MLNLCILGGRVTTFPTLKYFGENNPVTAFTMEFRKGEDIVGNMIVTCLNRLAQAAANLEFGDHVIVAGFLYRQTGFGDSGQAYVGDLQLIVRELLKCEFLGFEEESDRLIRVLKTIAQ